MARQFRSDDTSIWQELFGNGSDGALTIAANTTDSTANTTASATIGSTALTAGSGTGFAANNLILIHQSRNGGTGVGNWELNKISSIGSGTNWTLAYSTIYAYNTTAQVILLKQWSSVTINSGQTLTGQSWGGTVGGILPLFCNGTVTVTGNIVADGKGFIAQPSQNNDSAGKQSEGSAGAGGTLSSAANGSGGGGGQHVSTTAGGGGGGGNGVIGSGGLGSGGTGGSATGSADLTTAFFGGAGGQGADWGPVPTGAGGGNGGGLIFIFAPTITVTGTLSTNGASGLSNSHSGPDSTQAGGGGGGGAGGSILFKGQVITLGSSLVTASTGTGGAGRNDTGSQNLAGGAGAVGRIHADYSSSISGTTSPTIDTRQDSSLVTSRGGGSFIFNLI